MERSALFWPEGQRKSVGRRGSIMKAPSIRAVRCAVYTRVSTEYGLAQQFNTTTSMGRLTLNVLLSFAQFEREVTSERIRDKIAASKRKGLWVGGPLPLGYHMKDDKIAVVEDEAERVRLIYRRYLELSGVNALVQDLRKRDIRTRDGARATGATHGGIPFERGVDRPAPPPGQAAHALSVPSPPGRLSGRYLTAWATAKVAGSGSA